jgi:eukaryotic-like serine/threonine-protein kinase
MELERDEDIFEAAVALPPAERADLLSQLCAGDPLRQARIEQLLQAHGEAGGFMWSPAVARASAPAEKPGDVIDRYKLVQRIGEGGVGVVWLAQQMQPLRRTVALKVIKLGMDTQAVVARFEAERQALALMDHPNIARVFDAGVTSTGRPYFVMELVRGTPITRYCDAHRLTTARRLELFIAVCDALHHAHQKGIIHRDLKPSNILVTENGGVAVPKVIDFGIAKATQGRLGDQTIFTAFEQFIGTPAYMSPEQADLSSLDVDTRSDIYSLGVVLYQLLTGQPPFDRRLLQQGGIDDMRRRIREEEPARPSTRLGTLAADTRSTVAQQRGTLAARLVLELRGDLDWVVMRCIEKDRTRRYESASALAEDVRRHLRDQPVIARPPGTFYVLGKFIRRHRAGFAAATVTALVVLVGGSVSVWQAVRATGAEREQRRLRAVEAGLRGEAQAQEQLARRRAYAADMNLAQQALANDNLGLTKKLLVRQHPPPGQPDLRGWEWRYLWQRAQSEAISVLAEMPQPVSSLSVSPDGNWVALGQADGGRLSIVSLRTRQELRLEAGGGAVRAAFSPVEPLLAMAFTTGRDPPFQHRLRLWNLATRQVVAEWSSPTSPGTLAFSADGRSLVTAGNRRDSQITRWRVPTGEPLESLPGRGDNRAVAVTRDARWIARETPGGARGTLQVVELATGRERWSAGISDESISAMAFSADGALLATAAGNTDSSIQLWNTETGEPLVRLEGHRTYIAGLLFWPDGRTLASAGTDQTVRLWDVEQRVLRRTLRGHELEVHSLALLPDGTTLISGAKDGAVLLWDTAAPPEVSPVRVDGVAHWRFAPDSSVLTLDSRGALSRRHGRDFEHVEPLLEIGSAPQRGPAGARVAFAGAAPLVAVAEGDSIVRIYDWRNPSQPPRELNTGARTSAIVGFSASGEKLLLGYEGTPPGRHALHEWDLPTGRKTRSWHPTAGTPAFLSFATDGLRCAIRAADGSVTLVDLASGSERRLPITAPEGMSAAFSRDGRLFAAPSRVGWVKVWDLESAQPVAELSGFVLGVHSVAFSPDDTRLIAGSGGMEAMRVWDAAGFEPLLTLPGSGTMFGLSAFSPDGNIVGSRNAQGRLYLWRAPSRPEIEAAVQSDRARTRE